MRLHTAAFSPPGERRKQETAPLSPQLLLNSSVKSVRPADSTENRPAGERSDSQDIEFQRTKGGEQEGVRRRQKGEAGDLVCMLTELNTTNHKREQLKENENRQELNINSFTVQDLFCLGLNLCLPSSLSAALSFFPWDVVQLAFSFLEKKLWSSRGPCRSSHWMGQLIEQMIEL